MRDSAKSTVVAFVVVSSALVAGVLLADPVGTSDARAATTGHGADANYTVVPDNHQPGHEDGAVNHYAVGFKEDITLHYIVVKSDAFDFGDCSATKTRAFGIDRNNDDPGTKTDKSLLDAYKSIEFKQDKIVVEFYKKDQLGGNPVVVHTDDQIVARGVNCYDNPKEAGWYQVFGKVNGSKTSSDTKQTDFSQSVKTHYIYICDCSSRQEAEQKLGPPPSEQGGGGESTATATATATATPTATPGSGGEGTATDGGETTATRTSGESTASATPTSTGGGQATSSPGGGSGGGTPSAGTPTKTATQAAKQQPKRTVTPTSGGGPGFGAVAGVASLLAAALWAVRRRD